MSAAALTESLTTIASPRRVERAMRIIRSRARRKRIKVTPDTLAATIKAVTGQPIHVVERLPFGVAMGPSLIRIGGKSIGSGHLVLLDGLPDMAWHAAEAFGCWMWWAVLRMPIGAEHAAEHRAFGAALADRMCKGGAT